MRVIRRGEVVAPPSADERPEWGGGTFDLAAGGEIPPHLHDHHEEQIAVVEGRASLRVGDRVLHLDPGDVVVVERGEPHHLVAETAARGWFLKFPYLPDDRIPLP